MYQINNNNALILFAATSEWRTNQHHTACSYQQMENKSISKFTKFIVMIHATIKLFIHLIAAHHYLSTGVMERDREEGVGMHATISNLIIMQ